MATDDVRALTAEFFAESPGGGRRGEPAPARRQVRALFAVEPAEPAGAPGDDVASAGADVAGADVAGADVAGADVAGAEAAAGPAAERVVEAPPLGASPFVPEFQEAAHDVVERLWPVADAADPGADTARAVMTAARAIEDVDPRIVRFAVKLIANHHPKGRAIEVPALEERAPFKVVPSTLTAAAAPAPPPAAAPVPAEDRVAWFREDPQLNEHHDHWHAVYPGRGVPRSDPATGRVVWETKDRQGELFLYMHEQMIARYDSERLALGMPRVTEFADLTQPIDEGFVGSRSLAGFPEEWGHAFTDRRPGSRVPGVRLNDGSVYRPQEHVALGRACSDGIDAHGFAGTGGPSEEVHRVGSAVEATRANPVAALAGRPGAGYHNYGHVLIGAAGAQDGDVPMWDTDTAVRDPIFFRWHKAVDNLYARWQDTQEPWDLAADATRVGDVTLRRAADGSTGDLILVLEESVPPEARADGAALSAWGSAAFGGDNWDADADADAVAAPATDTLVTSSQRRDLVFTGHEGLRIPIAYLDQEPFLYAVRLENLSERERSVTVRLFLVDEEVADDRRMWIELDKYRADLAPGRNVVTRHARDSSVIRKPATKPPGPLRHSPDGGDDPARAADAVEESYCICGWPYNLLIPKGTVGGRPYRLLVTITSWDDDRVVESSCGSMSYCGAKEQYPDTKPMGYPFHRPFPGRVGATLATLPNTGFRRFTIRCRDDSFEASR